MKVAYITDDIYLEHDTGAFHPESKDRLVAINSAIEPIKDKLFHVRPKWVSREILEMIHTSEHVDRIIECSEFSLPIDADTILSTNSYDAAVKAVGAGLVAIDGIKDGTFDRAFCATRPPGHHATPTQAMGFCLFNSVAVTARYAQSVGYEKVMIIDFDVHHGNGTQDAFYDEDSVFYFSSHQALTYPGSGLENDKGVGIGEGYTANYLMMPESGDEYLLDIYQNELPKYISMFEPDIILVSAGYDLHESDPLAQLNITTDGVQRMARLILDSADVPFVFFLEGGYNVEALGENVRVTLEEMISS